MGTAWPTFSLVLPAAGLSLPSPPSPGVCRGFQGAIGWEPEGPFFLPYTSNTFLVVTWGFHDSFLLLFYTQESKLVRENLIF